MHCLPDSIYHDATDHGTASYGHGTACYGTACYGTACYGTTYDGALTMALLRWRSYDGALTASPLPIPLLTMSPLTTVLTNRRQVTLAEAEQNVSRTRTLELPSLRDEVRREHSRAAAAEGRLAASEAQVAISDPQ